MVKEHAGCRQRVRDRESCSERDVTERVKRKIEEEGEVNAPPRVVITGHSLGGAVWRLCVRRG